MFFDRDAWERFRLTKDEFALVKEADDKVAKSRADSLKMKADSVRAEKKDLILDLEGIDARKVRLTIASSSLGDALVSKDGETLFYLALFEKGLNLWSTNLRTKETKMLLQLNANGGNMAWDFGLAHPDLFAGVAIISGMPFRYAYRYLGHAERLAAEQRRQEDATRRARDGRVGVVTRRGYDWCARRGIAVRRGRLRHPAEAAVDERRPRAPT